jgi:high-affinity nickel-transport protein
MATRTPSDVPADIEGNLSFFQKASDKASVYHSRIPYISKLPFPAIAIIVTLIVVNLLVWAAVGVVLVRNLGQTLQLQRLRTNSSISIRL